MDRFSLSISIFVIVYTMSLFKTTRFYLKSIVFTCLILGCSVYGVLISILLRIIGKKRYSQYLVAQAFYSTISLALGIKINVKNEKYLKSNPAIYISNHQTALDIFVLGRVFRPGMTVTGKSSLKYVPLLGWFMYLSGTFFLDRSKSEKARKVLNGALTDLKRDDSGLFVFPEGTRSGTKDLTMLPFKKGAFHLAKSAKIPVVPVVVSNTSTIFNAKEKVFELGVINIEILKPIETTNLETNEEVSKFADFVRDQMVDTLKRIGYAQTNNQAATLKPSSTDSQSSDSPNETTKLLKKDTTTNKQEPISNNSSA